MKFRRNPLQPFVRDLSQDELHRLDLSVVFLDRVFPVKSRFVFCARDAVRSELRARTVMG